MLGVKRYMPHGGAYWLKISPLPRPSFLIKKRRLAARTKEVTILSGTSDNLAIPWEGTINVFDKLTNCPL